MEINQVGKKCLLNELAKLKESSKEAVEGLRSFSKFKRYMHVEREAQKDLEELIMRSHDSSKSQLILVCGSVGDGKSHIISYFKHTYPEIMNSFTLHNDATESLEPQKTSMDTLNEVLDNFSDRKIENSTEKLILAINLGTLNNFIDSDYGERFSKLKDYVHNKKILETTIENSTYDENSSFQFINFSDYHMFTLTEGKARSEYISEIICKITNKSDENDFYKIYKEACSECNNCNCCPIKFNYELLSKEYIQEAIIQLLIQSIIRYKIIISTRSLLNFIYELIVPRVNIDVNSPTFKNEISNLNNLKYIKSLMPNIIFDHKEMSFIFEALSGLDPLNIRNDKVDEFIIDFNNSTDIINYFDKYINESSNWIDRFRDSNIQEKNEDNIRREMIKLFIRTYYLLGKNEIFDLRDEVYESYIEYLYFWNKGEKSKLKKLYNEVDDGIVKWNGEAEKEYINIFMGRNQTKYKISQEISLKADLEDLQHSTEIDLKRFISTLNLGYKNKTVNESYKINIDFALYELLIRISKGYRPNKKDKNRFIKFVEFINIIQESGSKNEKLIFTEKNKEKNSKFKLEYDSEFKYYRFVEI